MSELVRKWRSVAGTGDHGCVFIPPAELRAILDMAAERDILLEETSDAGERVAQLEARIAELEDEREQILLAVFGGEDAPGYAASLGLKEVLGMVSWWNSRLSRLNEAEDGYNRVMGENAKMDAELSRLRTKPYVAVRALRRHHDWHNDIGTVLLPVEGGETVELNLTLEYHDSSLCETTLESLHTIHDDQPAVEQPIRDLVSRFSLALLEKIIASEAKYGWRNGWLRNDWEAKCRAEMLRHIEKGDPRDVAAYCAFMWHHGWNTSNGQQKPCPECGNDRGHHHGLCSQQEAGDQ